MKVLADLVSCEGFLPGLQMLPSTSSQGLSSVLAWGGGSVSTLHSFMSLSLCVKAHPTHMISLLTSITFHRPYLQIQSY